MVHGDVETVTQTWGKYRCKHGYWYRPLQEQKSLHATAQSLQLKGSLQPQLYAPQSKSLLNACQAEKDEAQRNGIVKCCSRGASSALRLFCYQP